METYTLSVYPYFLCFLGFHSILPIMVSFFVNLTRGGVIWEEEPLRKFLHRLGLFANVYFLLVIHGEDSALPDQLILYCIRK